MRLLVVTQDQDLIRALDVSLRGAGVRVLPCQRTFEVPGRIWSLLPDVLLVDLDLPLAESFQLLRKLRDDQLCSDVPVIATSAQFDAFSDEVQICRSELGVRAFLGRPFSMFELPGLVQSLAACDFEDDIGDFDTMDEELVSLAMFEEGSRGPVEALSLARYKEEQRRKAERRRELSLTERPLEDSVSTPSSDSIAQELERELQDLWRAGPNQVLGLAGFDSMERIRDAAQRRRQRFTDLQEDTRCVPRVRELATELLELVDVAESQLVGGW